MLRRLEALSVSLSPTPVAEHSPRAESRLAARLLRWLIAKSFLDVIFICIVASWAAFSNFSPWLRGAIDAADQTRVAGWAYDPRAPDEALEVQLFIDGRFTAARRADELRDDLVSAGATAGPHHGFTFAIEPLGLAPGRHAAQVYAVRRSAGRSKVLLPLAKYPIIFRVNR